jgi:hypothetical protein
MKTPKLFINWNLNGDGLRYSRMHRRLECAAGSAILDFCSDEIIPIRAAYLGCL